MRYRSPCRARAVQRCDTQGDPAAPPGRCDAETSLPAHRGTHWCDWDTLVWPGCSAWSLYLAMAGMLCTSGHRCPMSWVKQHGRGCPRGRRVQPWQEGLEGSVAVGAFAQIFSRSPVRLQRAEPSGQEVLFGPKEAVESFRVCFRATMSPRGGCGLAPVATPNLPLLFRAACPWLGDARPHSITAPQHHSPTSPPARSGWDQESCDR